MEPADGPAALQPEREEGGTALQRSRRGEDRSGGGEGFDVQAADANRAAARVRPRGVWQPAGPHRAPVHAADQALGEVRAGEGAAGGRTRRLGRVHVQAQARDQEDGPAIVRVSPAALRRRGEPIQAPRGGKAPARGG